MALALKQRERGRLISKKVTVLDCNCSWNGSKQGQARRYDYCQCKVRVRTGRKGAIERPIYDQTYTISTIFIAGHPEKAWKA